MSLSWRELSTTKTAPRARGARRLIAAAGVLACVTALLAITVPVATAKPLPPAQVAGFRKDLDALVVDGPPGAILLIRGKGGTVRLTSGVADIAQGTPMRAGDRYRVASLAKRCTSAVVLQLVGEGKLRLSDTVERWLPGLVPNGQTITIRQLLVIRAASSTTSSIRGSLRPTSPAT